MTGPTPTTPSEPDANATPAEEKPITVGSASELTMRTVRDVDGRRYLLLKQSTESVLVRDPESGERRYLPAETVETVEATTDGEPASALSVAADGVAEPVRRTLTAVHDERALGLLVELVDREAVGVRTLLSAYDLCESDLHGLLAEFRAAGLVAETEVGGERGYEPTAVAAAGVRALRAADGDPAPTDSDADDGREPTPAEPDR